MFLFFIFIINFIIRGMARFTCLVIFCFVFYYIASVCTFYGQDNEPILVLKLVSQLGQCTERKYQVKYAEFVLKLLR